MEIRNMDYMEFVFFVMIKSTAMKYPVLATQYLNDLSEFIDFWSKQYHYPYHVAYYTGNINKEEFKGPEIIKLYTWKNGMTLSQKKRNALDNKILSKMELINTCKRDKEFHYTTILEEFKDVSFVWKIFLLHIIKPYQYPIYDQHIHRAFKYLNSQDADLQKVNQHSFYFDHYLPFIKQQKIKDLKKLDEAFFAFGQFLNTKKYMTLLPRIRAF